MMTLIQNKNGMWGRKVLSAGSEVLVLIGSYQFQDGLDREWWSEYDIVASAIVPAGTEH